MTKKYPRRLIEVDLPIKQVSENASKEKNVRSHHPSKLHIWWARRPLGACRAVICSALWPDPADELCPQTFRDCCALQIDSFAKKVMSDEKLANSTTPESISNWNRISRNNHQLNANNKDHWPLLRNALLDFIADFSKWENASNPYYLQVCKKLTDCAHTALGGISGTKSLILDPFAGGGAIPIEASRVGADAIAGDLNPVATMINRVMLHHSAIYGDLLVDEVKKWSAIVLAEAEKKLEKYYPKPSEEETLIGYLWARTIKCEGPNCGLEVPIIRSFTISEKKDREAAVAVYYEANRLATHIVTGKKARGLKGGTSRRSSVTCPNCGYTTPRKRVEVQSNSSGFGYHLFATCIQGQNGERKYRDPQESDKEAFELAVNELQKWEQKTFGEFLAIPTEELPYLRSIFNVRVYGIDQWYKLFNPRQLLSALTFTEIMQSISSQIVKNNKDAGFATAVIECVALSISNSFQYQCSIATYLTEGVKSAFIQGQSLPMKMDFIEANPLMRGLAGGYEYSMLQHLSALENLVSFDHSEGTALQLSATEIAQTFPENSIDLIATDPPYYDVVPYADCSDFFFVWLRRMLINTDGFPINNELTPKSQEIVQLAERNERYANKTKEWFESKMAKALSSAKTVTKDDGIALIVFAHKETSAWEAMLQSVLIAQWVVTASWPIRTENSSRMRANESAVLGSSIHLVCRPRERNEVGDWRDVLQELPERIHAWLPRLAEEGVVGADAIFACLGPALEIFSRYARVEKASGEVITLGEYLEYVWGAVSREALNTVFAGADTTGFEEDSRLTAMWLWTLSTDDNETDSNKVVASTGYNLEYDAARKIAQGLGAHLEHLDHLVEVKGSNARLLPVAERTRYLFGKDGLQTDNKKRKPEPGAKQLSLLEQLPEESAAEWRLNEEAIIQSGKTMLDRVHQAMLLFAAGRSDALKSFLVTAGIGQDEGFWRLANALSALYPPVTDEKRWVDGVLARKKGLGF